MNVAPRGSWLGRRVAAACAGVLLAATVMAQPRTEAEVSREAVLPVTEPAAIGEWLKRLAGSFQFDGVINVVGRGDCPGTFCEHIKGTGNCVMIGTGPGVQCIFNVSWLDIFEIVQPGENMGEPSGVFEVPGGVSYLDPAMSLHGLDPGSAGISFLVVDNKGLPEGGTGSIKGNRATFRSPCVNAPALFNAMKPVRGAPYRSCERIVRIDSKPEANLVFLMIDIEVNDDLFTSLAMSLRREASQQTSKTGRRDK